MEERYSNEEDGRALLESLGDRKDVKSQKIAIAIILAIAVNIGNMIFSLFTISKIEIGLGKLLDPKTAHFPLK